MNNVLFFVVSVLLTVGAAGCGAAPEKAREKKLPRPPALQVENESEKAELIEDILQKHKLEVWRGQRTDEEYQFCEQFYQDLKTADPAIRYVEPVLRTDDAGHPDLQHYRTACSDRDDLPNDASTFWGLWVIGDKKYRLYREDFDGDSGNGKEEIIYADVFFERKKLNERGGYHFVDLETCEVVSGKSTHGYRNVSAQGTPVAVNNINSVIQYGKSYYVIELHDQKNEMKNDAHSKYILDIYNITENMIFAPTCRVRWRLKHLD